MHKSLPESSCAAADAHSQSIRAKLRILFADDEQNLRDLMAMELPRMGHEVVVCGDGKQAIELLGEQIFDAAILDIQMPGLNGIQVLEQSKKISPETEVVILTGHATVDTAVGALRLGAFDYLTKPCRWAELEIRLRKIAARRELAHKTRALENRLQAVEGDTRLIGQSPATQALRDMLRTVGPADCSVLILGETGTGKELTARELHESSQRKNMPFVPVNCGALPENLVESELFGHRRGSFTGADKHRKGLFEVADGGTLFLDEVGELDKTVQVKLLRFLESGEIRRIGDNEAFQVDVRVICATNRDLQEMVEQNEFRQDLYFRINTFELRLTPLRERIEEIPELVGHLLARKSRGGKSTPQVSPLALEVLGRYHWPGNVRELANVIERAQILAQAGPIRPEHLPQQIHSRPQTGQAPASCDMTLRDVEINHIQLVLEQHAGNKPAAAKALGISLKTLYNKLNQLTERQAKSA